MRAILLTFVAMAAIWLGGLLFSALMIPLIPVFALAALGALLYGLITPRRTRARRHSIRL